MDILTWLGNVTADYCQMGASENFTHFSDVLNSQTPFCYWGSIDFWVLVMLKLANPGHKSMALINFQPGNLILSLSPYIHADREAWWYIGKCRAVGRYSHHGILGTTFLKKGQGV